MAATYEPIASTTLGSGASTFSFTAIPSGYTDLRVVGTIRTTTNNAYDALQLRLNSDSGSNYSRTELNGTGSSATSSRQSNKSNLLVWYSAPASLGANEFPVFCLDIMSYSNTNVFKTLLLSFSGAHNLVQRQVQLWRSTSAVTSLDFTVEVAGSNFTTGSTFALYGIKAA